MFFFVMRVLPHRSTRVDLLSPDTTRFRSEGYGSIEEACRDAGFIAGYPLGADGGREAWERNIGSTGTIAACDANIDHCVLAEIYLRADAIGHDLFVRCARSAEIETGERNLRDLSEGLLVARPAQASGDVKHLADLPRSEEHTSELQSLMRNSYAVYCL